MQNPKRQTVPAKRAAIYAFDESRDSAPLTGRSWHKSRPAGITPSQQHDLVQPTAQASTRRTPLQPRGQLVSQSEFSGLQSPRTVPRRRREPAFPLGYSPASSNKQKTSQHPILTPPNIHPPSTSSASIPNSPNLIRPSLTDGRSLWQVSSFDSGVAGSSETGSLLRGPALRTPLFGNDGRTLEATRSLYF